MKVSVSSKPHTVKAIRRAAHIVMRAGSRRLNPFMLSIAGSRRLPLLAIIQHRGRRSSRLYSTPVVARPTKDGFAISLTFGQQADWFRNMQAAGECIVRWKGVDYPLVDPEVVDWASVRSAFPPLVRFLLPVIGIEHFVYLRHAPADNHVSQM